MVDEPLNNPRIVLLLGFSLLLFNSGMRFSLGLLLVPMADELDWSRTTLSSMATLYMVIAAAALPFTGRLVDYFGAMRVLLGGVLMAGLAIILTGFVNQPWQAYATYGILFALGSAATSITPIGVLLNRVYPQRAGLANSVAISGMGLGQLLIISVLSVWLVELGWRGSFAWLGIASIACLLPLLYWCSTVIPRNRTDLEATAKISANESAHEGTDTGTGAGTSESVSLLRSGLQRSPALWLVLVIYGICGFQDFLIATHIVALATDENISLPIAGNMLAFMGLAGLAGVLLAGLMTDRHGPIGPTLLCFVIRCVIFTAILVSRQPWVIVGVALLYGMTFWMTAPLTIVFARRIAGIALLGTLSGIITMVHHGLGGLGAIYGAYVYDQSGSYDDGLVTMLVLSVIAVIATLHLGGKLPGKA